MDLVVLIAVAALEWFLKLRTDVAAWLDRPLTNGSALIGLALLFNWHFTLRLASRKLMGQLDGIQKQILYLEQHVRRRE